MRCNKNLGHDRIYKINKIKNEFEEGIDVKINA